MPIERHDKKVMALTQLETALRLYFERQDYYSVLTLAGAADEILGQLLAADGRQSSLETLKAAVAAIDMHLHGATVPVRAKEVADRANRARNALKHWEPGEPLVVSFDSAEEAQDMLGRAVDNFWTLEKRLSPAMARFQREDRQSEPRTPAAEDAP